MKNYKIAIYFSGIEDLTLENETLLDGLLDDIGEIGLVDEYVIIPNHKHTYHFNK